MRVFETIPHPKHPDENFTDRGAADVRLPVRRPMIVKNPRAALRSWMMSIGGILAAGNFFVRPAEAHIAIPNVEPSTGLLIMAALLLVLLFITLVVILTKCWIEWRRPRDYLMNQRYGALGKRNPEEPTEHPVIELTPDLIRSEGVEPTDERQWRIGCATNQGRVRTQNEDAVCTLLLGNQPVVIIADGLGGEPFGREASQTAVDAAAAALTRVHEAAPDAAAVAPMQLVRVAFAAACSALAERAATMRLRGRRPGLKTTFIVAVASDTRFCFGYIGDGSLLRLRGGTVENLLVPHKASPDTPNLLTSCLGPEMIGTPVFDEAERMPDDVLMACTDGVADRVADKFYSTTVTGQMAAVRGDFDRAAADVLASLADYRREDEHVFDDNMTLAIVGGGKPPRRAPAIPLDVAV